VRIPWQTRPPACRVPRLVPAVVLPPEACHAGAARAAFLSYLLSYVTCSASQGPIATPPTGDRVPDRNASPRSHVCVSAEPDVAGANEPLRPLTASGDRSPNSRDGSIPAVVAAAALRPLWVVNEHSSGGCRTTAVRRARPLNHGGTARFAVVVYHPRPNASQPATLTSFYVMPSAVHAPIACAQDRSDIHSLLG
jgi:hypothetical protein